MTTTDTRKEGQNVPQVSFRARKDNDWYDFTSDDIFTNKTVVLFSLPGAFTPTCSSSHLPRYDRLAPVFKQHGVDEIVCLSVNDGFTMAAWQADQKTKNIRFIPDGNGEFTDGMGMLVDKSDLGFGKRSWRYSMLVKNGVVEKMFVEADVPGDPFEVSDADTMLNYLAPNAEIPSSITIISKPGCPHCQRAKQLLTDKSLAYEEITLGTAGISSLSLTALTGHSTVPQIFIDGELVGSADELEQYFSA